MGKNRPIFILSTGRAGSKMLAKTLALHPKLFCLHEPQPHLNPEAYTAWKNTKTEIEINESIKTKRDRLVSQTEDNQLIYCESSLYCSYLIPFLIDLYNPRFLFLYRDGRDFTRSALNKNWYKRDQNTSFILKYARQFLRRYFLKDLRGTWDDPKLDPPAQYKSRIEKIAWLWVEVNSMILKDLTRFEADYYPIKLEEFDKSKIKEILHFLGLDFSSSLLNSMINVSNNKPNKSKNKVHPPFSEWSGLEKKKFTIITSDMMSRLEYNL